MAIASVRTYRLRSPSLLTTPSGAWAHLGDTTWQVQPTRWPFVSAFVVRRPHAPPTLLTVAAETALLLENTNWRPGMALSWSGAALSCPSHMSRFLTESLGLYIAIESASAYGWHPLAAILDADRLDHTSPLYVPTGSRPDFIVETRSGWHGIEARGRSSAGPVGHHRPVAVQKKKLGGMHAWSIDVATRLSVTAPPSWSMSWAWITDANTSVDHFDPGVPVQLGDAERRSIWGSMSEVATRLTDVDDPRVQRIDALDRPVSIISRAVQDNYGTGRQTWLTIASWSERLLASELADRRQSDVRRGSEPFRELLLSGQVQATIGAFMATAITERPPLENELVELVEAMAIEPRTLAE